MSKATTKNSYVTRLVRALATGARPKINAQFAHDAALAVVRSLPSRPRGSKPLRITDQVKTARALIGRVNLNARAVIEEAVNHRYTTRCHRATLRLGHDPLSVPFARRVPHLLAERRRREEEADYAWGRALFELSMSDEFNAVLEDVTEKVS